METGSIFISHSASHHPHLPTLLQKQRTRYQVLRFAATLTPSRAQAHTQALTRSLHRSRALLQPASLVRVPARQCIHTKHGQQCRPLRTATTPWRASLQQSLLHAPLRQGLSFALTNACAAPGGDERHNSGMRGEADRQVLVQYWDAMQYRQDGDRRDAMAPQDVDGRRAARQL